LAFETNELHQKRREKELHARKQTENLGLGERVKERALVEKTRALKQQQEEC
jgi:hypothetical protein